MSDATWDAYRAQHVPPDAPPGFLRWLRTASRDGTWTHAQYGSTDGVHALLAAWQAGADARSNDNVAWFL